jgi:hypothetical protein
MTSLTHFQISVHISWVIKRLTSLIQWKHPVNIYMYIVLIDPLCQSCQSFSVYLSKLNMAFAPKRSISSWLGCSSMDTTKCPFLSF